MGECYYHGVEVYRGHPCEKCERKKPLNIPEFRAWAYRELEKLQGKDALAIQQGKIDFRKM